MKRSPTILEAGLTITTFLFAILSFISANDYDKVRKLLKVDGHIPAVLSTVVNDCEKTLPRNKKCVIKISAVEE